ncbi:MAG TPA: hypothetical protein VIQ11_20510, partial [Mycobacterium sp.]
MTAPSSEGSSGDFGSPRDSLDVLDGSSDGSAVGFGCLPNGLSSRGSVCGGLATSDVMPDRSDG